jgi:hypothetical protein
MSEYAVRLENGADTAPRVRLADALALQGTGPLSTRAGLRPDGGGEVTAVAGSMAVQVTPFVAWVEGSASDAQGGYPFINDATKTLVVADGHATLARVDTVAAVVYEDAYDGSGETMAHLTVVTGVPGAGAPVLPGSAVPLRDVNVPAGSSAGTGGLSSSNIGADRRQYLAAGVVPVSGVAERDTLGALPGQVVFRADIGALQLKQAGGWVTYKEDDGTAVASGEFSGVAYDASAGDSTVEVTFPPGRFTAPPKVTTTVTTGNPAGASGYCLCWPTGITTEGCTLRIRRNNDDSNVSAQWTAVQG